jgi:hypothetical protein
MPYLTPEKLNWCTSPATITADFSHILAQKPAAVLAEFAALVNDYARVDPNHPINVLLGSNLVI